MDSDTRAHCARQLPPLNAEHVYVSAAALVASAVPAAPGKETSFPMPHLAIAASCVEVVTWEAMQRLKQSVD